MRMMLLRVDLKLCFRYVKVEQVVMYKAWSPQGFPGQTRQAMEQFQLYPNLYSKRSEYGSMYLIWLNSTGTATA